MRSLCTCSEKRDQSIFLTAIVALLLCADLSLNCVNLFCFPSTLPLEGLSGWKGQWALLPPQLQFASPPTGAMASCRACGASVKDFAGLVRHCGGSRACLGVIAPGLRQRIEKLTQEEPRAKEGCRSKGRKGRGAKGKASKGSGKGSKGGGKGKKGGSKDKSAASGKGARQRPKDPTKPKKMEWSECESEDKSVDESESVSSYSYSEEENRPVPVLLSREAARSRSPLPRVIYVGHVRYVREP